MHIPSNSARFGGYRIISITAEQRQELSSGLLLDINTSQTRALVEDYTTLKDVQSYLPNSQPDKLYLFFNDEAGNHADQWNQIKESGRDGGREARRNFIAQFA